MKEGLVDPRPLAVEEACSGPRPLQSRHRQQVARLPGLGQLDRPEPGNLWNAFAAPHKGGPIYRKTGNLRAVQLLLGHSKLESTVSALRSMTPSPFPKASIFKQPGMAGSDRAGHSQS
jgi:hypothetical protein